MKNMLLAVLPAMVPNVQLASGRTYTIFARGFVAPPADNDNALGAEIIVNR